jgi:hypothetical protein
MMCVLLLKLGGLDLIETPDGELDLIHTSDGDSWYETPMRLPRAKAGIEQEWNMDGIGLEGEKDDGHHAND